MGTTITVFQHGQSQPVRQVFPKQDRIAPMMRIWLGAGPTAHPGPCRVRSKVG